jgi:hypothetical protein
MFCLRVNFKTKVLIMETAEMCGLTVTDVLRTVARWIDKGRVLFADPEKTTATVREKNGNVINLKISPDYHTELLDFLSADITMPKYCESQKQFRSLVVAACVVTQRKVRPEWERQKDFDRQLKECQLSSVQEKAALLGLGAAV